ncbi:hypothetical protein K523DRAFT_316121, partial [Schizophyllum commune Tattone D]
MRIRVATTLACAAFVLFDPCIQLPTSLLRRQGVLLLVSYHTAPTYSFLYLSTYLTAIKDSEHLCMYARQRPPRRSSTWDENT